VNELERALARIPNYERFYTLDELFAEAKRVAEAHPDVASYEEMGVSGDGEVIPMVRIGDGGEHVLLFACPHPNEPIGAMLVHFLLSELISNESLRQGRSWFLLPCVDPDGTRLNEGWFAGPYTIRNYARHFYRPRSEEQVEWTFPIHYKDLHFDTPIPETQSLIRAFERAQPNLVYSLHNAGFGGVYYYLSHDLSDVYDTLHEVPKARDLALSLGEPEMPWAVTFAPAVYKTSSIAEAYDYHETYGTGSAAESIQGGGSSYDYLQSRGDPVMLIAELPYFQSHQIDDQTPTEYTRREVILAGIAESREMVDALAALLAQMAPEMTLDTRFYRTVSSFTAQIQQGLESKRAWAEKAEGMDAPATVAQEVDERYVGSFYRLLIASMLRRALELQLAETPSETLEVCQRELETLLERWTAHLEENLEYSAIPIKTLVEVQYGALLAVLGSDRVRGRAVST
jgi:hypothetical protein